jgi:hypothetical protein
MAFTLQMLRTLMEDHPERAISLRRHVEALEACITSEPELCLHRVRTLFEAVHLTLAPELGLNFGDRTEFPARNSQIIRALDFSLPNHPESAKINAAIRQLLGSINGAASALAELSNIPNLRHGGSLDWSSLQRQHAVMLGGLCDTLVSFLFEVVWSRPKPALAATELAIYEDGELFNASIDAEYGDISVAGATFLPSRILYELDNTVYQAARLDWQAQQAIDAVGQEMA